METAGGAVSLGPIGYFRDQRFVEVRVAPVRLAADGAGLELFESPEAVLTWDPAHERHAAQIPEDPRAEASYRRLFLNYEEGRAWRTRQPRGPRGRPSGGGSSALPDGDTASLTSLDSASTSETNSLDAPAASELVTPLPPRARIRVDRDGLVQISQPLLASAAPVLASADPRTLRLTYRGVELPIRIQGEGDGNLGTGDFIEFYATRRTGEPPTIVRASQGLITPIYALNDFTDTNVYWLESGATAPLRVATLPAGPTGNVAIAPHWPARAVIDPANTFRPYGGNDPWIACPRIQDRSSSCSASACCDFPSHAFDVPLPDFTPAAGSVRLLVRLQGWTNGAHVADLSVNGQPLGTEPLRWNLFHDVDGVFNVSNAILSNPARVQVSLPGNGTGSADSVVVDLIDVEYRRLFRAAGGALEFRYPDAAARFAVEGFTSSNLVAYDLSRQANGHPIGRMLTGVRIEEPSVGVFRAILQQAAEGGSERRFLVAAPQAIGPPAEIVAVTTPAICDPTIGADLILIGHSSLLASNPALSSYVAHRQSQGLRVRVLDVQDVYDQFSFGFPETQGIRDFLSCAYSTGAPPPPLHVLLLGDGNSDYKNLRGKTTQENLVAAPVHAIEDTLFAYYAADDWLAALPNPAPLADDFVPDLLVGRISASDATEASQALGKIVEYETNPPAGAWRSHGLFVAGDGNGTAEDDFFVAESRTSAGFFTAPFTSSTLLYPLDPYLGSQANQFRIDLQLAINAGAAFVGYVGHGNVTIWDVDQIFKNSDVSLLTNVDRLPVFYTATCLMTAFHSEFSDSLGELLVHSTPDTGGIAVLAPSGISNFTIASSLNDVMLETMMGVRRERTLGEVVMAARLDLAELGALFDLENLTLLGDPSLQITLPAPAAPRGLTAAAGNLRVDLSWEMSANGIGYHLYRTQAANPAVGSGAVYTRLTSTPVTALLYADTQVSNIVTYSYAVTAIDASGFESGFSNLNTTCGASSADCVRATPYNPNPPSVPTGVAASNPGVGFRVDLTWNPNPEKDIRSYTVHYGTQQGGPYPSRVDTGALPRASINGLANGTRYYFAVTATNTSDGFTPPGATQPLRNVSALSAEVSAVPSLIQGIRPPARIRDLRATPTSDARSILLQWTKPLLDIYGNPATVTGFQVHRGFSVDFKPTADTRVVTLAADQASWLDADALLDARPFFYFVLATDGSGLLSSASRAQPTGISDLRVVQTLDQVSGLPNGNLTLSWSLVTHDIEGLPTIVDHYELYGASTPVGRGAISPSNLIAGNIRAASHTLPAPSGRFFYMLVAVDRRGNVSPF